MNNDIEQYIIQCIRAGKKPSGRIIQSYQYDKCELFCLAHNIQRPVCVVCSAPARFISLSRGFGKYCSRQCYNKSLSIRNTQTNSTRNKRFSDGKKQAYIEQHRDALQRSIIAYTTDQRLTINNIADANGLSRSFLRKYFRDHGITDKHRAAKVRKQNLSVTRFANIDALLSNKRWVSDRIDHGWSCKNFAHYLGCSANYVAVYIRNNHPDLVLNNTSSCEVAVRQYLDQIGVEYACRQRDIIPPKELDIYIPKHRVAIEINGIYWHSTGNVQSDYHANKTEMCNKNNIRLLHITDKEVQYKFDHVKSLINSSVGLSTKIHARKCAVHEITTQTYRRFCEANHIQGYAAASVRYGLFDDQRRLVAVIGFAKPRFNRKFDYELIRYCNILNHTVVGGAGKLFKYFTNNHPGQSVISYCQRRLFTGTMYKALGMQYITTTKPNYVWINEQNDVKTRYQTQRHKLNDQTNRTEYQIMTSRGYRQVFDSGQDVYCWHPVML